VSPLSRLRPDGPGSRLEGLRSGRATGLGVNTPNRPTAYIPRTGDLHPAGSASRSSCCTSSPPIFLSASLGGRGEHEVLEHLDFLFVDDLGIDLDGG